MIKLRPHHLLCVHKWRGFGYDENFSTNFQEISDRLGSGEQVQIVRGRDDICEKCPRAEGDPDCRAADAIDARVSDRLGLDVGSSRPPADILPAASALTVSADLTQICRSCPWLGLCAD